MSTRTATSVPSAGPAQAARLTSIVILTYNELECTRQCLESIGRNTPQPHEIILVDNGSTDGTLPFLREYCRGGDHLSLVENGRNLGFAAGCNIGMRQSRGDRILLLNNDVVVTRDWLSGLLECLDREPGAGLVGPMTNQIAGPQRVREVPYRETGALEEFARDFRSANRGRRIKLDTLVGFCLLFTRELLERIGELDESFGSGNFEDDDYCLRAALAGFSCVMAGDVFIHHYGSRSFAANGIDYARAIATNRAVFDAKWDLLGLDEALAKQVVTRNALSQGRRLAWRGQLAQSIDLILQQGIRFSPESCEPYRQLAEILIEADALEDALAVLAEMPQGAEADRTLLRAQCHYGLGQLEPAGELAGQLLAGGSPPAAALHLGGLLAHRQGHRERAERLFRGALEIDPGFGPASSELAALAWQRGAREEGLQLAERGFLLAPLSMSALARFNEYAVELGVLPREEQAVRAARAIHREHRGLAFGLIDILIRRGDYGEALKEIGKAGRAFGMDDTMIDAALQIRELAGPPAPAVRGTGSLSVCLIVKDEAQHLPGLLASVSPLADEIVVVDTGSSDRSADIARIFGARLFSFPWNGDFSQARNASLCAAQGDWILVLDADEVLADSDLDELAALLNQGGAPAAYSITTRNYTDEITRSNWTANSGDYPQEEQGRGFTPSAKVRLFPNDSRVRFEGAVHELLEPSLKACGIAIRECRVPVHHYGKLDLEKCAQKQEHYYELGLKKLAETGGDLDSLIELAIQATELKRYREAEELWHRLLAVQPEHAEAHFNLGYLLLSAGEYGKARVHALRGAQLAPDLKEAAFNLAKCDFYLGSLVQAHEECRVMLERWPGYPPALSLLCVSALLLGSDAEAAASAEQLRRRSFDCGDFLREYADGLRKGERGELAAPLLQFAETLAAGIAAS